jgi:ATP-dependent DNA helicase 2 subunit 2
MFTDDSSVQEGDLDIVECANQLETTGTNLSITLLNGFAGPWASVAAGSSKVDLVDISQVERECNIFAKPVEQRAKVRVSLEISPELQIPVGIYGKTLSVRLPGLKKRSRLAAAAAESAGKTDRVITEQTYHVADDSAGEEVKPEDRIKGHKYGQSIVPMSEYDEAALMYRSERAFKTLGFAPASSLGAEHSAGQIENVAADKGDRWAFAALESLISAMVAEKRILIARYCYRKNAWPKLVALIPHAGVGNSAGHLDLQYLPFADDIREWSFASLPLPSLDQRKAVSSLIDAMSLDGVSSISSSADAASEVLAPESTGSPSLARFYSFLARRAVDPAAKVPPLGTDHPYKSMECPKHILGKLELGNVSTELHKVFALQRVEKSSKKAKRFWREAIAEKRKETEFGEIDTKRIKVEAFTKKDEKEEEDKDKVKFEMGHVQRGGAASSDMAQAVPAVPALPPPKVHIGSVHPERDFERWLAHREGGHDTVGPAIDQMKRVIESFADEGEEFHGKALSCLTALRSGCVREGEVLAFNNFIRLLRAGKTTRKAKFWCRARDVGLGLITDGEAATSTVTAEESRAFLAGDSTAPPPLTPVEAAAPLSEQALEAMLE